MGAAMAGFILAAGYPVVVCSRSAASRRKLVDRGAREAADPAACARAADLLFASIPDDASTATISACGATESSAAVDAPVPQPASRSRRPLPPLTSRIRSADIRRCR